MITVISIALQISEYYTDSDLESMFKLSDYFESNKIIFRSS